MEIFLDNTDHSNTSVLALGGRPRRGLRGRRNKSERVGFGKEKKRDGGGVIIPFPNSFSHSPILLSSLFFRFLAALAPFFEGGGRGRSNSRDGRGGLANLDIQRKGKNHLPKDV